MNSMHYLLIFVTSLLLGGSRISSMNCESPLLTLMLQFNSVMPPGTSDRYSDVLHPAIALLFFDAALSGPTLSRTSGVIDIELQAANREKYFQYSGGTLCWECGSVICITFCHYSQLLLRP